MKQHTKKRIIIYGIAVIILFIGGIVLTRMSGEPTVLPLVEEDMEVVEGPYEGIEEGKDFGLTVIEDGYGDLKDGVYTVGYQEDELYETGIEIHTFQTHEQRERIIGVASSSEVVLARGGKTTELGNVPVPRIQATWDEMGE